MAINKPGESQAFNYNRNVQNFTIPFSGLYKLEVWGSQGENTNNNQATGGPGGYSLGYKLFKKGQIIYIVCGGQDGYNGGGSPDAGSIKDKNDFGSVLAGCGGGATHIAMSSGLLSEFNNKRNNVVIVAGGGSGGAGINAVGYPIINGKNGGGLIGEDGTYNTSTGADHPTIEGYAAKGGSQNSGGIGGYHKAMYTEYVDTQAYGTNGTFGHGGNGAQGMYGGLGSGGGGGWFGGGGGAASYTSNVGGGGSSYIGNVPTVTFKGKVYNSQTNSGINIGNGHALITLIGKSVPTLYLGDYPVEALYLGNIDTSDMYIGDTPIAWFRAN